MNRWVNPRCEPDPWTWIYIRLDHVDILRIISEQSNYHNIACLVILLDGFIIMSIKVKFNLLMVKFPSCIIRGNALVFFISVLNLKDWWNAMVFVIRVIDIALGSILIPCCNFQDGVCWYFQLVDI